jgi:TATA-box binding protein (TBP) (component of TFIID and TFIIIB)
MLEDDWNMFITSGELDINIRNNEDTFIENIPKASELYISTKTKIVYLTNKNIDLNELFWDIHIMPYNTSEDGIIKKQMKFISNNKCDLDYIKNKCSKYEIVDEYVIQHVEQEQGDNIMYKDVRKISIGISNKDLLSQRSKKKSAFYNSLVIILRLFYDNTFKEVHIKVFNTGKLEIPGVQNEGLFLKSVHYVCDLLKKLYKKSVDIGNIETVLINSNFECNYCINRSKLFDILKTQHNLNVSYDPCSYPGIQCKYNIPNTDITLSFMIFRTGSVLIVGKCEEDTIYKVHEFIKKILYDEYINIHEDYKLPEKNKDKKKYFKTKTLYFKN